MTSPSLAGVAAVDAAYFVAALPPPDAATISAAATSEASILPCVFIPITLASFPPDEPS